LKAEKVNNFYDLYLNPETSKYIFRILAIKEVMSSPSNFGYDIDQVELYKPLTTTRQIEVTGAIPDLTAFAIENGSTYRMLRYLNPWIIDRDLPATGKKLIILLP